MVYADSSAPTELLEAARIDGASEGRIVFTMVLRLLGPAMVTIFLFIFVATWNNFLLPLMMLSSQELKPVTLGLYGMMSYFSPEKGAVMLGALLGVLPLIVLFFTLQRYWRSSLAAGAVKGGCDSRNGWARPPERGRAHPCTRQEPMNSSGGPNSGASRTSTASPRPSTSNTVTVFAPARHSGAGA